MGGVLVAITVCQTVTEQAGRILVAVTVYRIVTEQIGGVLVAVTVCQTVTEQTGKGFGTKKPEVQDYCLYLRFYSFR